MPHPNYSFLRNVEMFRELTDDELEQVCQMAEAVRLEAGETLFEEGAAGDKAYIIKEGQMEIFKTAGERTVLLAVRGPGSVIGEISLLDATPRTASVQARTPVKLLALSAQNFNALIDNHPKFARKMLRTVSSRLVSTGQMLHESEKLAQIGSLAAGIAHELNNPAAAAGRAADQLQEALNRLQGCQFRLSRVGIGEAQLERISLWEALARERAGQPVGLDPLERSDQQEALGDWLEAAGVQNAWELAVPLVDLGLDESDLEEITASFTGEQSQVILEWLSNLFSAYSLLAEISQGAARISEIIKSLKSYVYLDQGPVQTVNLHEGLDNTLVMLRSKLRKGIAIHREYDPRLPTIQAFGSELNQVWTNLIDNASDALDGQGQIWIRTRAEGKWVFVQIEDNGPGIPEDVQERIFDPFFTTKAIGQGSGMGLNISANIIHKHGGGIRVFSHPGKTCFEVRLPVNYKTEQSGENMSDSMSVVDDDLLKNILQQTRNIAVVGISAREEAPAHNVPKYLQAQGYHIIPVNPGLETVLGEKAYPDLKAVPGPVDVALVFRRSEFVPEIVQQAVEIGAKVVWMQEGISNRDAAETGRQAGLEVVEDTCIRSTHRRLLGEKKQE